MSTASHSGHDAGPFSPDGSGRPPSPFAVSAGPGPAEARRADGSAGASRTAGRSAEAGFLRLDAASKSDKKAGMSFRRSRFGRVPAAPSPSRPARHGGRRGGFARPIPVPAPVPRLGRRA